MMGRLAVLVIGIIANGIATGLYIGAGLGPGPRDGLMTGLAARTGSSIRLVRTGIEITVLAVGWSLGGPVGLGTVLYAVSIGALSQYFIARLSVDGSASAHHKNPVVRTSSLPHAGCGRSRARSGDSRQEKKNEPATI
jgi:uncharacterized membrane protein YczE